jgi:L-seryl-tRNA(Ser) seleniumtransferase
MASEKPKPFSTLRDFPSVEILANHSSLTEYTRLLSRHLVVDAVKETIADLKGKFSEGETSVTEVDLITAVKTGLSSLARMSLAPVLNGTGIIIHTNLGRSPISEPMIRNSLDIVAGYSNLEYDLRNGKRGKRGFIVEKLLASLCETESGTLVNNNAAALFIILNTLAIRREVIISRGELVQIGGGFKIPEIMIRSGAKLVEVGTTNRTSLEDYRNAVTDRSRMILKVHRSNFVQEGFVQETSLKDLAGLCRDHNLILTHDLGSGLISFPPGVGISDEPRVFDSVRAGADLTCFSGDKLLGGTQAGLIAGRGDLIKTIKKNPLFRAIRCDKMVFFVTAQILTSYLNGTQFDDIPIWRMITIPVAELKKRGEAIIKACKDRNIVLLATQAYLGGGSTPERTIPSLALSIRSKQNATRLAKRFRDFTSPIIGRVETDDFLIDLRTIPPEKDATVIDAINSIVV